MMFLEGLTRGRGKPQSSNYSIFFFRICLVVGSINCFRNEGADFSLLSLRHSNYLGL
jgi:hypothetical protein